jgi:hypothetical protein
MDELTRARFALHYCDTGEPEKAAGLAGLAHEQGCALLADREMQALIERTWQALDAERQVEAAEHWTARVERIGRILHAMASSDLAEFMATKRTFRDLRDVRSEARACIAGLTVEQRHDGSTRVTQIKLHSKMAALHLQARMQAGYLKRRVKLIAKRTSATREQLATRLRVLANQFSVYHANPRLPATIEGQAVRVEEAK